MNYNHFVVAALPELTYESELPATLSVFLEENSFIFEPYMQELPLLFLLNDIRNMEIMLRQSLNPALKLDMFSPALITVEETERFLDNPFINHPDQYPEFMFDYFDRYQDAAERLANIEQLYTMYYSYLQGHPSGFLRYYARVSATLRTAVAAMRIIRAGLPLEDNLRGTPEIVETILEHRTSPDLGLKAVFPEIADVQAMFDYSAIDRERELDRIHFNLLEDVGQETPFGDHVVYAYIIKLFIRDRWNTLDRERGVQILRDTLQG
jgi:hypothetical protein